MWSRQLELLGQIAAENSGLLFGVTTGLGVAVQVFASPRLKTALGIAGLAVAGLSFAGLWGEVKRKKNSA